jgi:hypothetical protein
MADFDPDGKPRVRKEVVIEDLRHRRNVDEIDPEPEPEPEPQRPEPVHIAPIGHKQDAADEAIAELPVAATGAEGALENSRADIPVGQSAGADTNVGPTEDQPYSEDEIRAIEREQLRQIISLGLVNYLKYQLTMVLNFALLSLGSAPDPATGLIAKDLPQAKLAIDVLEFMVARLQGEMSVAERQQMAQLVSDLKYSFMQAAAEGTPSVGGPQGEA